MFIKQKDYDAFLIKVKIEIGEELGLEKADEAFVELRELPTIETLKMKELQDKGEVVLIEYFKSILPQCIVDHNLYETETEKMSNEAITDMIFDKTNLASKVVGEYIEKVFFTQAKKNEDK